MAAVAKKTTCMIRTHKFIKNPLLNRRQFVLEVLHEGRANVPKNELRDKLALMYKVSDKDCIYVWGFKTAFGGGRSTGFGCIYDSRASGMKFQPKFRQIRIGHGARGTEGRKLRKDKKTRAGKLRGKERAKILYGDSKKK